MGVVLIDYYLLSVLLEEVFDLNELRPSKNCALCMCSKFITKALQTC